jgi:penicillin V acylase-like amidase (Ntn superfamily)
MKTILIYFFLWCMLSVSEILTQCTSFCFCTGDTVLFGNTLDWYFSDGLVMVNKHNVSKTALGFPNPARWTSKYGSVTINQWGREFPMRGLNEAGLAIVRR